MIGLNDNEVIAACILAVNAYKSETNDNFLIIGSDKSKFITGWNRALLILYIGPGLFLPDHKLES